MAFVKQVDGTEPDTPPRKRRKNSADQSEEKMEVDEKPTNQDAPFAKPAFKAPLMPPPPMMTPPKLATKQKGDKTKKDDKNKKVDKSELALQPQQKHAETDEEKSRTIFISNIKYDCYQPEKKIRDLLLGCGEIEVSRIFKAMLLNNSDFKIRGIIMVPKFRKYFRLFDW